MPDLLPITIDEMIWEAQREADMRPRVYGRLVAAGKMKQRVADRQIEIQRAIVELLREYKAAGYGRGLNASSVSSGGALLPQAFRR